MKRLIVSVFYATLSCMVAFGVQGTNALNKAEMHERFLRRTGGRVEKPGSRQGVIFFADTQNRINATNINSVARFLANCTGFDVRYATTEAGAPMEVKERIKASLVVIVVDDADTPALLVAPEDGWAMVNVAKTCKGLNTDAARAKFHAERTRKELLRAYSLLCGGGGSQFPGNAMNCAKQEDIDTCEFQIPYDLASMHKRYLAEIGITPVVTAPYSKACREGWAPAPTNDYQKAIWEKVHEMPTEPIKIKPEAKKVKE